MHWSKIKDFESCLLITGETGTGKSYLAKRIHQTSKFKYEPYIAVNLATLKEDLFERELYGHKKGSFTGAIENQKGFCDVVGKGTLFLDEISEISLNAQKKLLQLLEEKTYFPVGETQQKAFYGRVICATNKDIKRLVSEGKFRQDLFFRLNIFHTHCPGLREEIKNLQEISRKICEQHFPYFELNLSVEVLQFLSHYPWPGNIRELKNCLEYLSYFRPQKVKIADLPQWLFDTTTEQRDMSVSPYWKAIQEFEKSYLQFHLQKNHGKVNLTSEEIKLSKATLISKAKVYGINTALMRASQ